MKPVQGFLVLMAVAVLAGCGSGRPSHTTAPLRTAGVTTTPVPGATAPRPGLQTPPSSTTSWTRARGSAARGPAPSPGPYGRRSPRASWKQGALETAKAFVEWFDRWVAGESTARQAPEVTAAYAAKLRASTDNVPPAVKGHVATIVHLILAGMPPDAPDPREAWIYTATRSQGVVIQFTVKERLFGSRWLVYDLYQGP